MKVYISGAITGLNYEEAKANFQAAGELLEAIGMVPVNPMNNGLELNAPWETHMVKDIEMLMDCQGIIMLSNWIGSRGARIEKFIAHEMGMIVLYESSVSIDQPIIFALKCDIERITGLCFDKRDKQRVSEDGLYCNMLFARHARDIHNMSNDDIAYALMKSKESISRYLRDYEIEYKFNKRFRRLANETEKHLSNNVSL